MAMMPVPMRDRAARAVASIYVRASRWHPKRRPGSKAPPQLRACATSATRKLAQPGHIRPTAGERAAAPSAVPMAKGTACPGRPVARCARCALPAVLFIVVVAIAVAEANVSPTPICYYP